MSLQIFTRAIRFTKWIFIASLVLATSAQAEWNVDFSRRADQMGKKDNMMVPGSQKSEGPGIVDTLFQQVVPTEEIVILNTENGFLPNTIRLRENVQYRFVVVNINEKAKNVSFILDAFSEHHATFYGQMKSFYVSPKTAGIFTFVSPETSAKGRVVVQGSAPRTDDVIPQVAPSAPVDVRAPASRE